MGTLKGSIEFENVHFTYPARQDAMVLNDISFNIPAGTIAALVGPSGGTAHVLGLVSLSL